MGRMTPDERARLEALAKLWREPHHDPTAYQCADDLEALLAELGAEDHMRSIATDIRHTVAPTEYKTETLKVGDGPVDVTVQVPPPDGRAKFVCVRCGHDPHTGICHYGCRTDEYDPGCQCDNL